MGLIKSWHKKEKADIKEEIKVEKNKKKEYLLKYYALVKEFKIQHVPMLDLRGTGINPYQVLQSVSEEDIKKIDIMLEALKNKQ